MNEEEKNDFRKHQKLFQAVLNDIYNRARLPWQLLIRPEPEDPRLSEWFDPKVLIYVRSRREQRLIAERAGKILFALNDDDPSESDPIVLAGKKKLRAMMGK